MASSTWLLLVFLSSLCFMKEPHLLCAGDPTDGYVAVPLSESNLGKQWPYDLRLEDRYSYVDGVRKLWVYSTDKEHFKGSKTRPRTEIAVRGYGYTSGVWQFEGHAYVPSGTSGVSIMQIFGASKHATTLMLHVHDGALKYYIWNVVEEKIHDRWFRLNVIHDTCAKRVEVFVDGALRLSVGDRGGKEHYFKFGVYAQANNSEYMESRWKDVKVLKA